LFFLLSIPEQKYYSQPEMKIHSKKQKAPCCI
jgi:hypothetical protein